VFVIVSPENVDGETCYRVAISRKCGPPLLSDAVLWLALIMVGPWSPSSREGIPPFGPALPQSAVIKRNEEGRQWLLTKRM
jgi:hypothetical protein